MVTTTVILICFISRLNNSYCEYSECLNIKICVWSRIITNFSNFYPLEAVGRGSETQLQVGENLNC